ncbi:hypothetical protein ABDB91_02770 [Desulfoscipio sp. XC116]|uniref:hypothetical protein n=1 Tax=Desulfoscipio sp. XC116 TaxID=3144975 RepID=UPI00325BB71D
MAAINTKAILLVRLSETEIPDLETFDCGDAEMNRFLRKEAYSEQEAGMNSTILLYYTGELAAFCSVCCDSIPLSNKEREEEKIEAQYKVPAIKIARLGRSIRFREYGLGGFLIDYIKDIAYELSTSKIGVRFITLDAYPGKEKYYLDNGFIRNEGNE